MTGKRKPLPFSRLRNIKCDCGCTGVTPIECIFNGKSVPTGILRHNGVERYHKVNSVRDMHRGAHWMDDDELLFHLSCYDCTACPTPDKTHLRLLLHQSEFTEAQPFPSNLKGWRRWPAQAPEWRAGEGVRYGDVALLATQTRSGSRETFSAKVLAVLPLVDRVVLVDTAPPSEDVADYCAKWSWLDKVDGAPVRLAPKSAFEALESQIIAVQPGPLWRVKESASQ